MDPKARRGRCGSRPTRHGCGTAGCGSSPAGRSPFPCMRAGLIAPTVPASEVERTTREAVGAQAADVMDQHPDVESDILVRQGSPAAILVKVFKGRRHARGRVSRAGRVLRPAAGFAKGSSADHRAVCPVVIVLLPDRAGAVELEDRLRVGAGGNPHARVLASLQRRLDMSSSADAPIPPAATDRFAVVDRYWRAANYLSVGQIYLLDNPLLREPLAGARQAAAARSLGDDARAEPRLRPPDRGDPRARPEGDLHHRPRPRRPGGRGRRVSGGTYTEVYPTSPRQGRVARAVPPVLVPRWHPSHVAPGDARARSTRAASSATRCRMRSARRSTTPTWSSPASSATARRRPGRSPTSWHSNKFLNPVGDGAVLPILHLNGYKIANPTVLARIPERGARTTASGLRLGAVIVAAATTNRRQRPRAIADALDEALDEHPRAPAQRAQRTVEAARAGR